MINVIVVPEKEEFIEPVSHKNIVWINTKKTGIPKLSEKNVKYLVPFWLRDKYSGVRKIYHILESTGSEITLGNSFLVETDFTMKQRRKFEYHSLETFNFIEVKEGFLIPYKFK